MEGGDALLVDSDDVGGVDEVDGAFVEGDAHAAEEVEVVDADVELSDFQALAGLDLAVGFAGGADALEVLGLDVFAVGFSFFLPLADVVGASSVAGLGDVDG